MRCLLLIAALLALGLVAGCGNKGPLVRAGNTHWSRTLEPAPATSAPLAPAPAASAAAGER